MGTKDTPFEIDYHAGGVRLDTRINPMCNYRFHDGQKHLSVPLDETLLLFDLKRPGLGSNLLVAVRIIS